MYQEILDMVKIFDVPNASGRGAGDAQSPRPTLDDFIAFLHDESQRQSGADGGSLSDAAMRERVREAVAHSNIASNFEDIIQQHIAFNGNAANKHLAAVHQSQLLKRKQAKRAPSSGGTKGSGGSRQAGSGTTTTTWQEGDEVVHQMVTGDNRIVSLFRSLGYVEGISVELHRLDQQGNPRGKPKTIGKPASAPTTAAAPPEEDEELEYPYDETDMYSDDIDLGDDDMAADDVVVHEEDLQQINHMVTKLEPLSQETLEQLSNEWESTFPSGGEHLLYRTNITERIRYLAATVVVSVADRFRLLKSNTDNSEEAVQERMVLVNKLVLSLWHGVNALSEKIRKHFAVIFGLDAESTPEDVCVTVVGLGIATFFTPISIPLLQNVCSELDIPPLDVSTLDPDLIHEALTHQICAHFYPFLKSIPSMNLPCLTQLRVHENGPGSYTCTLDNALLMDLILRQVHVSNKFSCQKVKWRARVEVQNGFLNFVVWHRDTQNRTFNVHLVLRTSDPRKKKKGGAPGQEDTTVPTATVSATGATTTIGGLYLEKIDVAPPETHVGFGSIVSLEQVYRHLTTSSHGLRLYNRIEDRIVFQFSLKINPVEATAGKDASGHAAEADEAAKPSSANEPSDAKKKGSDKAAKKDNKVSENGRTIAELLEQEEREKREKAAAKNKQKLEKRIKQLETTETQGRDAVVGQYQTAHNQLLQECQRSQQKALQKKKDRERKAELAKVAPSVELQTQVASLEQTVKAAKTALHKLIQEKNKEEKELVSLQAQIEVQSSERDSLRETSEENERTLAELLEEINETEVKLSEKKERAERRLAEKEARRANRARKQQTAAVSTAAFTVEDSHSSMHHALAIKDFSSFWSTPSSSNPVSAGVVGQTEASSFSVSAPSQGAPAQQTSPALSSVVSLLGGLAGGPTSPYPQQGGLPPSAPTMNSANPFGFSAESGPLFGMNPSGPSPPLFGYPPMMQDPFKNNANFPSSNNGSLNPPGMFAGSSFAGGPPYPPAGGGQPSMGMPSGGGGFGGAGPAGPFHPYHPQMPVMMGHHPNMRMGPGGAPPAQGGSGAYPGNSMGHPPPNNSQNNPQMSTNARPFYPAASGSGNSNNNTNNNANHARRW